MAPIQKTKKHSFSFILKIIDLNDNFIALGNINVSSLNAVTSLGCGEFTFLRLTKPSGRMIPLIFLQAVQCGPPTTPIPAMSQIHLGLYQ